MESGIYQIANKISGKRYIGSAKDIGKRWGEHRSRLRRGNHHCKPLQNSWNKHGELVFEFTVLESCAPELLVGREQFNIDDLKPEFNVCRTAGNTLGCFHSEETKAKIKAKAVGRKCEPRSQEYRKNISAALKGKQKSPEHMAALQVGRRSQVFSDERKASVSGSLKLAYSSGMRKREKSDDHKAKIAKAFAQLSEIQVQEIRMLSLAGERGCKLADRFNLARSVICNIVNRKTYKWVA